MESSSSNSTSGTGPSSTIGMAKPTDEQCAAHSGPNPSSTKDAHTSLPANNIMPSSDGASAGNANIRQISEQYKLMPIAIIGMSCRLSGDVSSLEDFWEMLTRARCGWSEIPNERFSKDAYYHPNPAKKGTFNTVGGYFLKQDPALFDAAFFNITQAEAEAMGAL